MHPLVLFRGFLLANASSCIVAAIDSPFSAATQVPSLPSEAPDQTIYTDSAASQSTAPPSQDDWAGSLATCHTNSMLPSSSQEGTAVERCVGLNTEVESCLNAIVDSSLNAEVESGGLNAEVESGGLNAEVESGLNAEVESGLNAEVESGLNAEVESGLNAEVESGLNAEVESGGLNAEVESGGLNAEVESGGLNAEVESGGLNAEVESGGLNAEVESGGLNAEVESGGLNAEVESGGLNPEAESGLNAEVETVGALNAEVETVGALNAEVETVGALNAEVESGSLNAEVESGSLNAEVESGLNSEVESGGLNSEVEAGGLNSEVEPGGLNAEVETGSLNAEVELFGLNAEVQPGLKAELESGLNVEAESGSNVEAESGIGNEVESSFQASELIDDDWKEALECADTSFGHFNEAQDCEDADIAEKMFSEEITKEFNEAHEVCNITSEQPSQTDETLLPDNLPSESSNTINCDPEVQESCPQNVSSVLKPTDSKNHGTESSALPGDAGDLDVHDPYAFEEEDSNLENPGLFSTAQDSSRHVEEPPEEDGPGVTFSDDENIFCDTPALENEDVYEYPDIGDELSSDTLSESEGEEAQPPQMKFVASKPLPPSVKAAKIPVLKHQPPLLEKGDNKQGNYPFSQSLRKIMQVSLVP